jgi:hypothetical protein
MMARIKKMKQDELDAEDFSLVRPIKSLKEMPGQKAEPVLDDYITEVMMMMMFSYLNYKR